MSVKDYALELGVDSSEVLNKLKELGYSYKNENKDIRRAKLVKSIFEKVYY